MNSYGYRRRYYARRYPYGTRRRAYTTTSRSKRRAIGNYRAAQQQKDSTDVNLSIPSSLTCFNGETQVGVAGGVTQVLYNGVCAVNIWDVLRKSEFYQSYASMYDQVKINAIRVKITPYSFPLLNNNDFNTFYRSYTVVTAWDRTGLSDSQLLLALNEEEGDPSVPFIGINPTTNEKDPNDGLYINIDADKIGTYSSAITKNVNPNSNTAIIRRLYPSTLAEKAQFINTSDLKQWYTEYDSEKARFVGIKNFKGVSSSKVISVEDADDDLEAGIPVSPLRLLGDPNIASNPSYIEECPLIPFKPTLLVGLKNDIVTQKIGNEPEITITPSMSFNLEYDIGVTFRGLRKANVV